MNKDTKRKIAVITLFAIAMGLLEAAVVIYLRKLYYPQGFDFPLRGFVEPSILGVEWVREFATIIMLVTIAMIAARTFYTRFAYFLYTFAVWDIFYYVFLKLWLDWPTSFFTWDILFLIPWPWAGPVATPLLCTVLMITTAYLILYNTDKGKMVRFNSKEWALISAGVVLVLYTWMVDYGTILIQGGYLSDFFTLATNPALLQQIGAYYPLQYSWVVFLIGWILCTLAVVLFAARMNNQKK